MFRENEKKGLLITEEFHELVKKIAKMTERTGGWRNFCTDDPTEALQVMFIGSRLRDTSLGIFDDGNITLADKELKWGDMPKEEIDRDDLLELYHGTTVDGLVYSYPMVRFRVTPDNRYYLLDYETDFGKNDEREVFVEEQALEISRDWIKKMAEIHGLIAGITDTQ